MPDTVSSNASGQQEIFPGIVFTGLLLSLLFLIFFMPLLPTVAVAEETAQSEPKAFKRVESNITLRQVRSISQGPSSTNPFDYREVEAGIEAVKQPPGTGGGPLTSLVAGGFYATGPSNTLFLPIEKSGAGTAGDFSTASNPANAVAIVWEPGKSPNPYQAVISPHAGWSIVSQTPANPVPLPSSPPGASIVLTLRRSSDGSYFKVSMELLANGSGFYVLNFNGASCGASAGGCP